MAEAGVSPERSITASGVATAPSSAKATERVAVAILLGMGVDQRAPFVKKTRSEATAHLRQVALMSSGSP